MTPSVPWCRSAGAGRVGHRSRQVGGIAGAVLDGGAVEIDRRHRQVGGVLPGATV